jgi:hypothetical protein
MALGHKSLLALRDRVRRNPHGAGDGFPPARRASRRDEDTAQEGAGDHYELSHPHRLPSRAARDAPQHSRSTA